MFAMFPCALRDLTSARLLSRGTPGADRASKCFCLLMFVLVTLSACATQKMPPWEPPHPQPAHPPADHGGLSELEAEIHLRHGSDNSGFMLLDSNEEGLRWRLALIDTALQSIDAQYYLWYGDTAGRLLIQHLLRTIQFDIDPNLSNFVKVRRELIQRSV